VFWFSEWFLLALAIAAMSLFRASRTQRPLKNRLWKHDHWWVLTHLLFSRGRRPIQVAGWLSPEPIWRFGLGDSLFRVLASGAAWAWRMGGFRWFGISLVGLTELPILGALLAAVLSVSPMSAPDAAHIFSALRVTACEAHVADVGAQASARVFPWIGDPSGAMNSGTDGGFQSAWRFSGAPTGSLKPCAD
jgi:hypothetical protein